VKGGNEIMSNLSEIELQNLRHLLLFSDTDKEKYTAYAERCTDPYVKQFFQKEAQSAEQKKQTLIQFLK
jgi:type III secretory pathway component EscR